MATGGAEPVSPTPSPATEGRLDSWKEIASYLKRSVRTVTRWEREQGLPVHRHKTGTVYAYKPELDVWWTSHRQQIESEPPLAAPPQRSWWRRLLVPTAIAGLIAATVLVGFILRPHLTVQPRLFPLTTDPGVEGPPSLSPDGNQVTFSHNGDIYVKQVDGEAKVQLTNTPAIDAAPAWSPDGRRIAFIRDGTGIFLISPLGGGEKKLTEIHAPVGNDLRLMAWTPDSQSLIFSELTSTICASLFIVSIETGVKKRLTWPPEPSIGDRWPSVSPDGKTLAFARFPQDNSPNVHVMPIAGGKARQITSDKASQWGLTWTPDGREIVFSSERTGAASRLWRISTNSWSRSPSPVEVAGENARFPSFSHPGPGAPTRLAYQRYVENINLRRAEIIGAGTPQQSLKPSSLFAPTTMMEAEAQFSPDGKKIALSSARSGVWEIWLCDSDGSNLVPLTSLGGPRVGGSRWSPDGSRITFFSTTGSKGEFQIYVVDAAGGSPRRLSRDDGQKDFRPSWSRDGRWIYFGSTRSGTIQIWKMAADGGLPIQITKHGGAEPLESADGTIYYTNVPEAGPGLWSVPTGGGEEVQVLNSVRFGFWAVAEKGIYFIDLDAANGVPKPVKYFSFQSRQTTQIGAVEKGVALWGGLAVSPDGRWLLYPSLESTEADLMLVDNFR